MIILWQGSRTGAVRSNLVSILTINFRLEPRRLGLQALLAVFVCITSCASRNEIVDLYENTDYIDRSYERVLVVSFSSNANEREKFESSMAAAIRADGNDAIASHKVLGFSVPLSGQAIENAKDVSSSDAILVTHMASVQGDPTQQEGRVDVDMTCRKGAIYDPFLYDYAELKAPDEIGISHTATVVANLYDAEENVRIWAVQSTCFDRDSWPEIIVDQTNIIANQLQNNWLQN